MAAKTQNEDTHLQGKILVICPLIHNFDQIYAAVGELSVTARFGFVVLYNSHSRLFEAATEQSTG